MMAGGKAALSRGRHETNDNCYAHLGEIAEFWRVARRLHAVYAELDRTF